MQAKNINTKRICHDLSPFVSTPKQARVIQGWCCRPCLYQKPLGHVVQDLSGFVSKDEGQLQKGYFGSSKKATYGNPKQTAYGSIVFQGKPHRVNRKQATQLSTILSKYSNSGRGKRKVLWLWVVFPLQSHPHTATGSRRGGG
jgi:hypothetical protein